MSDFTRVAGYCCGLGLLFAGITLAIVVSLWFLPLALAGDLLMLYSIFQGQ